MCNPQTIAKDAIYRDRNFDPRSLCSPLGPAWDTSGSPGGPPSEHLRPLAIPVALPTASSQECAHFCAKRAPFPVLYRPRRLLSVVAADSRLVCRQNPPQHHARAPFSTTPASSPRWTTPMVQESVLQQTWFARRLCPFDFF